MKRTPPKGGVWFDGDEVCDVSEDGGTLDLDFGPPVTPELQDVTMTYQSGVLTWRFGNKSKSVIWGPHEVPARDYRPFVFLYDDQELRSKDIRANASIQFSRKCRRRTED